jgi:hypothetical protein
MSLPGREFVASEAEGPLFFGRFSNRLKPVPFATKRLRRSSLKRSSSRAEARSEEVNKRLRSARLKPCPVTKPLARRVFSQLVRPVSLALRPTSLALLAVCLLSGAARAQGSPFVGDWKLDPAKTRMPDEMRVESKGGNNYTFDFAGVPETIAVDGSDQPGVRGTLLSVKPESPDTWIVERKKDGKLLLRATWKLAKDGSTLKDYYREFEPGGSTVSMDYVYQRAGGGPGFAADWQSIQETLNTPYSLQVKAYEGDGLAFVSPTEQVTKNVKFDGKDYPNQGPNAGASSSVRRIDERTLEMTDKDGGKVTDTEQIEVSRDGKTLTITVHIPGRDKPNVMVFERQ